MSFFVHKLLYTLSGSAAYRYELKGVALDVMLAATMLAAASLAYEAYSLCKLHRLHTDIEEAALAEEANKARRSS